MTATELQQAIDAKRAALREVLEQTKDGSTYDFAKATAAWLGAEIVGEKDATAKSIKVAEAVRAANDELNELCEKAEKLRAAGAGLDALSKADQAHRTVPFPNDGGNGGVKERKSFGQRVVEHAVFKSWQKGSKDGQIVLPDIGLAELKALFQTTAGWAPETTRTGVVVPIATRPLQVLDILPTGNTGQASVVYMEETTFTNAAAETAEGAAKPESAFALTEKSSPVREVANSVPVTDIQLEDVPMVESYLDGRLNFGIQQRLDGQVITGNGVAPNLTGILNTVGIQTQAKGVDPVPDAIYKAGTKLRVTGRVVPTHVLMHPNDWQEVRLLRTNDGVYIWGSPSEAGLERIWGWPVVQSDILTEGTGLIGSFQLPWITLFERRGIVVERGFVGTQFRDNQQTIRASGRWALVVYRPAAFATITGI